jgi:S1-C subfamily serine protease
MKATQAQSFTKSPGAACIFIIALAMITIAAFPVYAGHAESDVRNAVVKIYTVSSEPYYFNPWMTMPANSVNGSGAIIKDNKILTSAHVVANQTFIEVRKYGDSRKYNARILHISHESDLALLTVDNKNFFKNTKPLELGHLPEVQQDVLIFGYPGGDALSITRGTLSKLHHRDYMHSSAFLLAGQINASVKPGNSGGPVIVNSKLAGVVMQAAINSSLAHMVPAPIVRHFLEDVDDGAYDGFPDIGLVTQTMENPSMKKKYGMLDGQTGVVINTVLPGSPAEGKLQKDDILVAVNSHLIDDNRSIEFRPREHTDFLYFIQKEQIGSSVNIDVLRDGRIQNFTLKLNQTRNNFLLVPHEANDREPRYFIYAGIVFSPLTKNFINSWDGASEELIVEMSNHPSNERKEIVVALQVLPAEINKGYHNLNSWIVDSVNGKAFRDFNEFYRLVTTSAVQYTTFMNRSGYQVVIDREKAEESHESILRTYSVRKDRSSDLADLHANRKSRFVSNSN